MARLSNPVIQSNSKSCHPERSVSYAKRSSHTRGTLGFACSSDSFCPSNKPQIPRTFSPRFARLRATRNDNHNEQRCGIAEAMSWYRPKKAKTKPSFARPDGRELALSEVEGAAVPTRSVADDNGMSSTSLGLNADC